MIMRSHVVNFSGEKTLFDKKHSDESFSAKRRLSVSVRKRRSKVFSPDISITAFSRAPMPCFLIVLMQKTGTFSFALSAAQSMTIFFFLLYRKNLFL